MSLCFTLGYTNQESLTLVTTLYKFIRASDRTTFTYEPVAFFLERLHLKYNELTLRQSSSEQCDTQSAALKVNSCLKARQALRLKVCR